MAVEVGQSNVAKKATDFDLPNMLSHLLRRAHFSAEAQFALTLGKSGITSRQLAMLVAIAQNPQASQNALGKIVVLDQNTISDMVSRMVKKGLIERQVSATSKRSYELRLTEAASTILANAASMDTDYQSGLVQNLSARDSKRLVSLLQKMLGIRSETS